MRKSRPILLLFSALVLCGVVAAQAPPAADQVLSKARAEAAAQNKSIFLIFSSSW
jgi:hypothetical protein